MPSSIKLSDDHFQKFDLDFTAGTDLSNIPLSGLISVVDKIHANTPVDNIKLISGTLDIDFLDGRHWIVTFQSRSLNTLVNYNINSHSWLRDLINNYISPLTTAILDLYANYSLTKVDIKPA